MKLGILGGSFNPFHNGHLYLAEQAIAGLNLDRVVFVPAYQSPFKLDSNGTEKNAAGRIAAIAAAIAGDPRFALDDCEIKREGVSYTVNTVEDIIERYASTGKPYLIIGDDLAADFPKWRESARILEMAEILIGSRLQVAGSRLDHPFPHIKLNNEIIDVSSSKIRQLMKEGQDYSSLIPSASSVSSVSFVIQKIETEARETLSTARFLHSRHTALLAYDMCRRLQNEYPGLEPMDGYLAGIAHDLAKQLDPKEMLKLAQKDGNPISRLEKDRLNLTHGRAAAVLLKKRFSIHNKDILEAVARHTLPDENIGALAKVIYIADKLDASRNIDPALRRMCYNDDLDDILLTVLINFEQKMKQKKLEPSKGTLRLLNKLKERKI